MQQLSTWFALHAWVGAVGAGAGAAEPEGFGIADATRAREKAVMIAENCILADLSGARKS